MRWSRQHLPRDVAATMQANCDGHSIVAEVRREGGRFVVVVDETPVAAAGSFDGAVGSMVRELRRRLPRRRRGMWGVAFDCSTTRGVTFGYGNESGGAREPNQCVTTAVADFRDDALPRALEHAGATLMDCCGQLAKRLAPHEARAAG